MSEEKLVKVLDDYGVLSTFRPKRNETVIMKVDSDKVDVNTASHWVEVLSKLYPKNNVLLMLDGMILESVEED